MIHIFKPISIDSRPPAEGGLYNVAVPTDSFLCHIHTPDLLIVALSLSSQREELMPCRLKSPSQLQNSLLRAWCLAANTHPLRIQKHSYPTTTPCHHRKCRTNGRVLAHITKAAISGDKRDIYMPDANHRSSPRPLDDRPDENIRPSRSLDDLPLPPNLPQPDLPLLVRNGQQAASHTKRHGRDATQRRAGRRPVLVDGAGWQMDYTMFARVS